jgi:hypothetical protein
MASSPTARKRFARLTLSHSKKLTHHLAGVCRVHEALTPDARHQNTPAMAVGVADHPLLPRSLLKFYALAT